MEVSVLFSPNNSKSVYTFDIFDITNILCNKVNLVFLIRSVYFQYLYRFNKNQLWRYTYRLTGITVSQLEKMFSRFRSPCLFARNNLIRSVSFRRGSSVSHTRLQGKNVNQFLRFVFVFCFFFFRFSSTNTTDAEGFFISIIVIIFSASAVFLYTRHIIWK